MTDTGNIAHELATSKRHRDAARRDLAVITAKLNNLRDKKDELCSVLAFLSGLFLVLHSSFLLFSSRFDSILTRVLFSSDSGANVST